MDDRQRKLFVNVVDAGSFSKAAEAGYVTPQSVSQHMKRLEAELGVKLLERTAQGVVPTEAGIAFYDGCKSIDAELDALVDRCHELGNLPHRKIRLAMSQRYSLSLYPKFLPEYLQTHPEEDLEYVEIKTDVPVDELKAGAFDVLEGIRATDPDVAFLPLMESKRYVLVSSKSPLARMTRVRPADLVGRKVYVFSLIWAQNLADYLERTCPGVELYEAPASDYGSVLHLCENGEAVYLSPDHIRNRFEPLLPIELDVDVHTEYGLLYLREQEPLLQEFLACATHAF